MKRTLVSRKANNAMIHNVDEAVEHVLRMIIDQQVKTETGKLIPIQADSICVHGDGPEALAFVEQIRDTLLQKNIEITTI